jgi:hypothetical protein
MTVAQPCPAPQRAAPETPATQPRTWQFTDRRTGEQRVFTCLPGCTINHPRDFDRPVFAEDVWCWTEAEPLTLPVNENGTPEEYRILDTIIKVEPWSPTIAHRLPFAVVELVDDHFIDGLDPDGLETVINTLAGRLDQMRATHARLVEARNEYRTRTA